MPAQRDKAKADAPTVVGQVAAYEADKSITVETKKRGQASVKTEFGSGGNGFRRLTERLGLLSPHELHGVDTAMRIQLGLAA